MDKIVKKKWLEALRSGKYKQGKRYLYNRKNDRYCCLGVLSCILGESKQEIEGDAYPSAEVCDKAGIKYDGLLPEPVKFPRGKTKYYDLAEMNDRGISFNKIADVIEKYL